MATGAVKHMDLVGGHVQVHDVVGLDGADLYVYGLPVCSDCAKGVIQVGVKRVFMCYPADIPDKWRESMMLTNSMFMEAGIEYHHETV